MKSNFGAQVSVVEYDSDSHDLRTVSLHVFEDEAMRSGTNYIKIGHPGKLVFSKRKGLQEVLFS